MDIEGKPFSKRSHTVATSARDSHTIPFSFPEPLRKTGSLFDGKQRTLGQNNRIGLAKAKKKQPLAPTQRIRYIGLHTPK